MNAVDVAFESKSKKNKKKLLTLLWSFLDSNKSNLVCGLTVSIPRVSLFRFSFGYACRPRPLSMVNGFPFRLLNLQGASDFRQKLHLFLHGYKRFKLNSFQRPTRIEANLTLHTPDCDWLKWSQ